LEQLMMSKVFCGVRARGVAAGLVLLLLLAACGGGTQVERFVPTRMLVFGDESSVIDDSDVAAPGDRTANGRKHTVNGLTSATPPLPDCSLNPIWTQYLLGLWGLTVPQCNPRGLATSSRIYAQAGAGVGDLAAQIDAAGAMGDKDISTVLAGANDIFALYAQYPGVGEDVLIAQARARAVTLAAQIARIVKAGSKVVFVTLPDLGATPFAAKQNAAFNQDRAGVLSRLTTAFNTRLRTEVSSPSSASFIDGHQGVQVLADELFRTIVNIVNTAPSSSTYLNASVGLCDPALAASVLDCTGSTLLTATSTPVALASGGSVSNYLWADDKHLSPGGHAALGSAAANRTNSNPL
jgi:outer membrane lipase/esterase